MAAAETIPVLRDLLLAGAEYLQRHGIDHARRECEWIFAEVLACSRLDLYTRYDMPLGEDQVTALRELVTRRGRREPLAYLLGTQPFCGLDLRVSSAVLVPRPETEELVAAILADTALPSEEPCRVADLGTGSGAIALALAAARPAWEVHAADLSHEALAVAADNIQRTGHHIHLHHGDLHHPLPPGSWHLVVANLPYVAAEERGLCSPETAFEPAQALFAEDGGLALIHRLLAALPDLLADDGVAWLEHGFAQQERLLAACQRLGLAAGGRVDAAGHPRFIRVTR